MKKTDLIKVIREIVRQELKKELPNALAQTFTKLMGQAQNHKININNNPNLNTIISAEEDIPVQSSNEMDEMESLKSQLSEMLNKGHAPTKRNQMPQQKQQFVQSKQYTNNPVLNEVLNATRPFNSGERMAMRAGGGAMGMVSPGVAMAASRYSSSDTSMGVGQMMEDSELNFMNNVPGMPGVNNGPMLTNLPTHAQPIHEGQEGGTAPLNGMAIDSALDLKNHPSLPDNIKNILNRDYRSLVRAMDKKK